MAYSFEQMLNKIQNGKYMCRPSWGNGQFLMSTPYTNYVMYCVPSNNLNPCTNYQLSLNDALANDWVEKS